MTPRGRWFRIAVFACTWLATAAAVDAAAEAPPVAPAELAAAKSELDRERHAAAESLATVALARLEAQRPADSLAIALALEYAGTAHWRRSGYADGVGLRYASRALGIRERHLGANDLRLADAHALVARFLPEAGRVDSAQAHVRRAIAIRSAQQPAPDDTLIAKTWDQLALIQRNSGDMKGALDSWTKAIELQKRAQGPENPDVARLLGQTGVPWMEMGDLDHARSVLEESLRMFARTAPDDPRRWIALNILGDVERRSGNLTRDADLIQEALRIVGAAYGDDSREAISLRTNLAVVLNELGDNAGSVAINRELLPQVLAQYGPTHARTLVVQHGMAIGYLGMRDFESSATLLRDVERTLSGVSGAQGLLSKVRAQYAQVLYDLGRDAEARVMADSAVATALAMPTVESGTLSAAYITQITSRSESGDTAAIASAQRALLAVDERFRLGTLQLGPMVHLNLARAATVLGQTDEAWRLALDAERQSREFVQLNLSTLSDRKALLYTRDEARYMLTVNELARRSGDPVRVETALDQLVRNRGLVRTEIARRRLPQGAESDTTLVALHDRWIAAQRDWARRIVRAGGVPADSSRRAALERLHDEAENAETAYATALAARGVSATPASVGWNEIRARLRPGQTLVSCTVANEELAWRVGRDSARVVVFVARGGSDRIELVDLGNRTRLEAAIEPWRKRLAVSPGADARRGDAAEQEIRRLGRTARAASWDRIAPAIGDAKDVYIVDEFPLVDLPWQALPDGKDRYLVETGPRIHVLGAERELVDRRESPPTNALLALGAPDYDRDAAGDDAAKTQVAAVVRSAPDPCADGRLPTFAPLPASGVEAEAAAREWRALPQHDALVLTGTAANEAAFKRSAQGRAVLHLATHGVVAGDRCSAASDGTRGVGGLEPLSPAATTKPSKTSAPPEPPGSPPESRSPWLSRRVWLALAGANRALEHTNDDDGLLTAEEVVTLDLAGTDWVVLSACHSGVTDWSSDGALGMRRAFLLAGARTVIASQWAVEDASTAEWMKALYAARASGAASAAEAVESASRHVLAERRKDGRTTHPFYWAAFGASGE